MRVEYERLDRGENKGEERFRDKYRYTYRLRNWKEYDIVPCCERMGHALAGGIIDFGENGAGTLNTLPKMAFEYSSGDDSEYEEAIDFCPFCGQAIECVEVARFKLVRKIVKRMRLCEETEEKEVPE